MSLNDIRLPASLLVSLYRHVLVEGERVVVQEINPVEKVSPRPPGSPGFLGGNARKLCVVNRDSSSPYINDDDLHFLAEVLKACRMGLPDVAIFNHARQPLDYHILREQATPAIVILFGLHPQELSLPVEFPPFQIQTFDQVRYLCAPPLQEIAASRPLKSQLWACLKQLFSL